MTEKELRIMMGRHLVSGFRGPVFTEEYKALVREWKIGNIILFSDNITSLEQLNKLCHEMDEFITGETGYHPLITIDQEGGMVSRLPEGSPVLPSQMALASFSDEDLIEEASYRNGMMLKALGCNVNLSPVLDINTNTHNPVIGVRSFSSSPEEVARFGAASVRGYNRAGIYSSAKHFPGHGDTGVDSHLALPVVDKPLSELAPELLPFKRAIAEGVPAVTTSHILFPKIEKEKVPCTMSHTILTELLRGELGFKGIILSDCMEMKAIADYYGTVEGSIKSLKAGADLVFVSHHGDIAAEVIKKGVELYKQGYFNEEFEESTVRVMKAQKEIQPVELIDTTQFDTLIPYFDGLQKKSIKCVHGKLGKIDGPIAFVGPEAYITSKIADKLDRVSFPQAMHDAIPDSSSFLISSEPDEEEIEKLRQSVKADTVVFGTYNGHLQKGQIRAMKALKREGRRIIHFALRNPYDVNDETIAICDASFTSFEYSARCFAAISELIKENR